MSNVLFNFHDTLLLAISFQSISFMLLLLLAPRDRHPSDFFLAAFFFAQALIPIHLLINYGDLVRDIALTKAPNAFHAFEVAYWIEGPLLLWYTRSLLHTQFKLRRKDLLYILPLIGFVIYIIATFYALSPDEKLATLMASPSQEAPSMAHGVQALRELLFVTFCFICLRDILTAQQESNHRFANVKTIDFAWLGLLIAGFMLARTWNLLITSIAFVNPTLGPSLFNVLGLSGNYLMFAIINILIFFSLTRSSLLAGKLVTDHPYHSLTTEPLDNALKSA